MSVCVEMKNVVKKYKTTEALSDFNLTINGSQIVGLFGPNGSGKTTTIKILASVLKQYEGTVLINGVKPGFETKSVVSYLPDANFLDENKKVSYAVKLYKTFFADFSEEKAKMLLVKFNIDLDTKISALSKGNKEKLHTILIVSRKASLYLFDEPIAGVDPASREVVYEIITECCDKDSIIIITTHLIADIESVIDTAVFIKEGKVVLNERKEEFESNELGLNDRFKEVFKCL